MELGFDLVEWLRWLQDRWHRRSTLIIVLGMIAVIMLALFSGIDFEQISLLEVLSMGAVLVIVVLWWFRDTRAPKATKGTIGFAIAISTATKEQHEQLAQDFVSELRDILNRGNLSHRFSVVEFPQYYAQRIQTGEDARKYLRDSRCHFFIYGRARLHQIQGEDHHILRMEGVVP